MNTNTPKSKWKQDPAYFKAWYQNNLERERAKRKKWSREFMDKYPDKKLLNIAKNRAKSLGIQFDIDISDITIPTHCPVLGIEMKPNRGRHQDNSPSLDRIDPLKGYVKGNVAVICFKANRIKNNASYEEILKVGNWLKEFVNG